MTDQDATMIPKDPIDAGDDEEEGLLNTPPREL